MKKENELNYFAFDFWNGILIGFAINKWSEDRTGFVIYLPFMRFAWIKEMIDDDEANNLGF